MRASIIVASVAGSVVLLGLPSIASDDRIPFVGDELVFELVGEVTNFATPPPFGSSIQYGYLTKVRGIDDVFSGSPHNETTALFTFFNEATTTETNVLAIQLTQVTSTNCGAVSAPVAVAGRV